MTGHLGLAVATFEAETWTITDTGGLFEARHVASGVPKANRALVTLLSPIQARADNGACVSRYDRGLQAPRPRGRAVPHRLVRRRPP